MGALGAPISAWEMSLLLSSPVPWALGCSCSGVFYCDLKAEFAACPVTTVLVLLFRSKLSLPLSGTLSHVRMVL